MSHVISEEASKSMKGGNAYFCTHNDGSEHIYAGYESGTEVAVDNPQVSSCEEMIIE